MERVLRWRAEIAAFGVGRRSAYERGTGIGGFEELVAGGDGDPHRAEFAAGLRRFGAGGEALDERAEFAIASVVLLHGDERIGFVQMGGRYLGIVRIALEDLVIALDCRAELFSFGIHLTDIEVGVTGEVVIRVGFDERVEL